MQRKFFIFLSVFIWGITISPTFTFANECSHTCRIQDSPSPALEQYLNNVSKVVNNVSSAISSSERETSSIERNQESILASLSQVINFTGFFSSFDFYVAIPITQEVPYPIRRDHERLQQENERLSRLLESITRRWYGNARVDNPCEGVTDRCNLTGSARYVLTVLLKNNKKITDMYRLSIADNMYLSETDFLLVPNNFESEFQNSYNQDTLSDCSQCDGSYMDRIQESIDRISHLNIWGTEGIRKWREAWALLTGAAWDSMRTQEEDRLLREYLWWQWISGDAADAVTDNLQNYNSGGLSTSNPLFNSANYTFSRAEEDVNTFVEGAIQNYLDTSRERIPIVIVNSTASEIATTQDLETTIAELYENQLPFAAVQDTRVSQIISKIIRMHYSLADSINILDGTVKVSEQVCDSQWQGQGRCSFQ